MKLVSIMIVLLIVGYMVSRQLAPVSSSNSVNEALESKQKNTPPKVPTAPQGVKSFEGDMNKFIQDTAAERDKELDRIEGL